MRIRLWRLFGRLVPDDMWDVDLSNTDDGPDYQCACGRWLPCRHCHPAL